VGHSHSCICDNDNTNSNGNGNGNDHDTAHGSSYYSYDTSKGAKSGSYYYGKGAVDSGKVSKGGKGKGASASYYYYNNGKDAKKSKQEKSKGSGKGFNYDDDYVYPTPHPTKSPTGPTPLTPAPVGGPTQPTMSPDSGRNNTPNPTSRPTEPKQPVCSVNSNGLYGQKLGLSSEFRFLYQAQVIPSMTVADLNLDIVPKVEVQMGNDLLPKLFPAECRSTSLGAVAARSPVGGNGNRHGRKLMVVDNHDHNHNHNHNENEDENYNGNENENENDLEDSAIIFENAIRGRARRELQSLIPLNGISIKPRDMVDEDATCGGAVTAMFPCFVIEGIVTIFSEKNLDAARRFQIENAIQETIKNGNLVEADNQILSLTWSGFLEPQPQPEPEAGMWAWIFEMAWWILALIVTGIILVLVLMLVVCTRMYRRWQSQKQTKPALPLSKRSPKPKIDVEQLLAPMDDSSSSSSSSSNSSSSSIATGDNLFFAVGGTNGPVTDPKNTDYQYHSDDHINESLMPNIDEPIVEEGQEDLSSGRFDQETTLPTDRYNGVSYEDRIYQNNQQQSMGYNPNLNRQYSNESLDRTQNGSERPIISESSEEHSRSRHLSRHNKEFRELEGRAPNSMASPRHLNSGASTPASNYSSDIHSNPSGHMTYRDEEVVDEDDDSSYEDVEEEEEEYEIEYASQAERMADEATDTMYESMYMDEEIISPESMYEEVWVDENDPTSSNSNSNRSSNINTNSNSYSNGNSSNNANTSYSNSNNDSTYGSGSGSGSGSSGSKEENTPLPFLAHNAQLQQQVHKTSFDSLRQKWEQT